MLRLKITEIEKMYISKIYVIGSEKLIYNERYLKISITVFRKGILLKIKISNVQE